MKKLLTFLTLLTLFFGVGWANEATFAPSNFSGQGTEGTGSAISATVDGVTFACNKGYGAAQIRCYKNGTIIISSDNTITGIAFTFSGSYNGGMSTSYTNLSTNSWTQELTSQARITAITVTYTTGGSQTTKYDVTCNPAEHGSISVGSTTSYTEGATVTVTATPENGYKLNTVTVTPTTSGVATPEVTISGNTATFQMPASDVTVDATFAPITYVQYKLVEKASDLVAGAEYIIAGRYTSSNSYTALLGAINSNIGSSITTGFSYIDTDKIINVEENCEVTPLTLGGTEDAWTFYNGSAYLAYTSSSTSGSNYLYTVNSIGTTNVAKWTINTENLPSSNALIINNYNNNRKIQFNSDRFCCYTGTQSPIALFKKVETGAYTIECADGIEHGSISASPSTADAGKTITVTATPDAGYELSTVTVTPESGSAPEVTISGNSATFEMPASNVTVSATFALAWNSITSTCTPSTGGQVWVNPSGDAGVVVTDGTSTSQMGTSVTFKVVPANGFNISTVTATDESGATVNLTQGDTNESHGGWGTYYTFTMPSSAVTINATFTEGNLYIIGTANDNTWDGNIGVQMTYDTQNKVFTKDVFFSATDNGNFSFADALSGQDGSWANMGRRYGAPSNEYDLQSNGWTATWDSGKQDNSFKVPAGVYTITVNKATGSVTVAPKTVTVTLDKAAGQLETGTTVNVVSNLTSLLQACKSGMSATLAYSTDDGTSYTDGSSFPVNQAMTAKGKAYYGKIEAESDSYAYTVVTHYAVTATANPTEGGTVSVSPASALAGETVTITATPKSGYELSSITVNGTAIEPNEGVYSFIMPAQATEVIANFSKIQYAITKAETKCTIDITEGVTVTDGNITAGSGDLVKFTITPISNKYYISSVTLVWGDGTTTTTPTLTEGVYSFNMQARPVTITAVCEREAVGDGSFILVTDATTLNAGDKVIITNSGTAGSAYAMSTTQNSNNRGQAAVTITDDLKITPGETVQVLTLEGDENGWYFNAGNGYLYAAGGNSNNNYLRTASLEVAGDNAKATISVSGNAVITFQGTAQRKVIRYNNGIFSCYTATGQSPVYLFKQSATGLAVEIDPNGGDVIGSQVVTIDANVEGAMVQYKIGDGEWSTPAEAPVTTTITGNVGDEVVVYAKATMDDEGETLEDETSSTFTFVAPAAPTITPASCSIASETQTVTITSGYADGTIEYSTDGGATWTAYNGQFNVVVEGIGQSVTVQARVTYNGVVSEVAEATYTRGVQPVVFSPASGTYYGDQTCQMFSTTKGARIYYTTDGSEPVMNQGTTQLYTGEVAMPATGTYNFKAVAYIGTTPSEISSVNYTIKNTSEYVSPSQYDNPKLYSVAELNAVEVPTESPYYTTSYYEMVNPVQVIYMSTYKQNGYQPEFCLVRDNTGYGMIYFGKQNTSHNNYSVFNMGDWIGGGYSGQVSNFYDPNQQVLSDTHPELGRSGQGTHIYNWIEEAMSNSAVLPEYLTIPEIKSSDPTGAGNDYWGHYVHLRKNTIELVQSDDPGNYTTGQDKDGKWSGTITDENGQSIMYYDKFYLQCNEGWTLNNNLFTGHPNRTFDVYGFVACYKNVYQISPFDFAWIDMPICDHVTETYTEEQTVSLSSPDDPTATIWYKTSEMDDFHVCTEPFTVNSTTTVEWYATKQSQYNDELESKRGTITMTFEDIAKPVISPESNVYAVGESVDASIAYEEGNVSPIAVILYTTDGSDPKTSETAQEYTIGTTTLHFTTTTTVRAITRVGNLYSAEADAKTYTFVKSNGIEYTLIDDVTKLKENGVYVIVSQDYSEAMSTTQNVNNRGAAGVLFVEGTNKAKVYGNDDVAQFTLSVLTHDEDTSPERHFLMQTNNSNVNGYLYVGHDVNNSLMTEAEEDAMGNDVAVITIDADGRAHIHFNYAGGDNRYLQYWNRDRLFNTYKTEYDDRAVYIYGVEATPLATIEKDMTAAPDKQVTVADQLVAVYMTGNMLWCKDQGNVSIAKTENPDPDNIEDYMQVHGGFVDAENKARDWDQSNWVALKFPNATEEQLATIKGYEGKFIAPASVTGLYIDDVNYTIEMTTNTLQVTDGEAYNENLYCAANFLTDNHNGNATGHTPNTTNKHYFFVNPKIQEVCEVTFAMWKADGDNGYFVLPEANGTNNDSRIYGAFNVDWTYNDVGPAETIVATLSNEANQNKVYKFTAIVQRPATGSQNAPRLKSDPFEPMDDVSPDGTYIVYPLDLNPSSENSIVTRIDNIFTGNGDIKSVKYVNVAGIVSDKPFQGVNIVVTEYTDGTRTTSKMLRK